MYNFEEHLLIGTMPRNTDLNKSDQFTAIYTHSTQYVSLWMSNVGLFIAFKMVSVLVSEID